MSSPNTSTSDDPFDLTRFLDAQEGVYEQALSELHAGRKRSHWMWFIFPQLDGLGSSPTAKLYAISNLEEARAYLEHPILGIRLRICAKAVAEIDGRSALEIFGAPDDRKLHSCATLFALAAGYLCEFDEVLAKYFEKQPDHRTIQILEEQEDAEEDE